MRREGKEEEGEEVEREGAGGMKEGKRREKERERGRE